MESRTLTYREWIDERARRFCRNHLKWRFICPSCGHVAKVEDWKLSGESEGEVAFSCVGRHIKGSAEMFDGKKGPCNYAGGPLFKLNPVTVVFESGNRATYFEFADPEPNEAGDVEPGGTDG